jgi:hypothetical protein
MFDVINAINALDDVTAGQTVTQNWFPLYNAQNQLQSLFTSSPYSTHLRISRDTGAELHESLKDIVGDASNQERVVADHEVWLLKYRRDAFKPVFISEVSTLPSFLVMEKEGYDINLLIGDGKKLFPGTLPAKAPEAIRDALEVGKAIAFELPTAAGFHIFRVVEAVLKRYWDQVSSQKDRPRLETIGTYASALEDNTFGDPKVWSRLSSLANCIAIR